MKRTSLIVVSLLVGLVLLPLAARAAGPITFSQPIIVGGDSRGTPEEARQSQAYFLKFFKHKVNTTAGANFTQSPNILGPDYPGVQVDDLAATPGFSDNRIITKAADLLDKMDARFGGLFNGDTGNEHQGLDMDDFWWPYAAAASSGGSTTQWLLTGVDYQLTGGRNQMSHRLVVGDVRAEAGSDESDTLFGLSAALEASLIGDASERAPYSDETYPVTVAKEKTIFRYCMVNNPLLPWKGYNCAQVLQFGPEYVHGVMPFDIADLGTGLVSGAYDPFTVQVNGYVYTMNNTASALQAKPNGNPPIAEVNDVEMPFYGPLAFFRMVDRAGPAYRFSGYTSFDMKHETTTFGGLGSANDLKIKLLLALANNWMLPVLTNPVAVDAVDLLGAGRPDGCTGVACDTDLAVTYRTSLFDLRDQVYDRAARPLVTLGLDPAKPAHESWGSMLGTCSGSPCTPDNFKPLNDCSSGMCALQAPLHDWVLTPVVFYKQKNEWTPSDVPKGNFINSNPSHIVEFSGMALVGKDMHDAEMITDTPGSARRQSLVVPSAETEEEKAFLYLVSKGGETVFLRDVKGTAATGGGTASCVPAQNFTPIAMLPAEAIIIKRPVIGTQPHFIPYQVKAANLDGDACADILVTWSGEKTIRLNNTGDAEGNMGGSVNDYTNDAFKHDINKAFQVAFSHDGSAPKDGGLPFSNQVSIVLRKLDGTKCRAATDTEYAGLPMSLSVNGAMVASAAAGDVDGDGVLDIVMGDMIPRVIADPTSPDVGKIASTAYVFYGPAYLPSAKQEVRLGGVAQPVTDDIFQMLTKTPGVAMLEIDEAAAGPQAIAANNGMPLSLPSVGCPKYKAGDKTADVGSVFESYLSIDYNVLAAFAVKKYNSSATDKVFYPEYPFTPLGDAITKTGVTETIDDMSLRPVPPRCVEKQQCVYTMNNGEKITLPFFEEDPCCTHPCSTMCKRYLTSYPNSCLLFTEFLDSCDASTDAGPLVKPVASAWRPDEVVAGEGHALGMLRSMRPVAGDPAPVAIDNNADQYKVGAGANEPVTIDNNADKYKAGGAYDTWAGGDIFKPVECVMDGVQTAGEECDPPAAEKGACETDLNLGTGQAYQGVCIECHCIPILSGAVKLPKSPLFKPDVMHRELTVVVKKGVPTEAVCDKTDATWTHPPEGCDETDLAHPLSEQCDGFGPNPSCDANCQCSRNPPTETVCDKDGIKDPGEQCDTNGVPDLAAALAAQCTDPEVTSGQKVIEGCEMNNCQCMYSYPECQSKPDAQCHNTQYCVNLMGAGAVCDVTCNCIPPPTQTGETPETPEVPLTADCSVKCLSFSSEEAQKAYDKQNQTGKEVTGLTIDWVCEPEQRVQFICTVPGAADPKAQASVSDSVPGLKPYMLIQQTGSEFIDNSTLEWMRFTRLPSPVRVLPLEALEANSAQTVKAIVLPDLSASADGATMVGVEPMATTSARIASGGTAVINNMIEFKTYRLIGAAAQKVMSAGGTAETAVVQEWTTTMPPLCGPYTGVEGAENVAECQKPIEEKQYDPAQFLAVVRDSLSATPTSADYTDFVPGKLAKGTEKPWEESQKFQFSLVSDTDAGQQINNVMVATGPPTMFGQGSGCNCSLGGAAPAASELFLMLVTVLVPAAGFTAWRVRRRGRK